jgi:glycosyltransferase A (GT-A) superfamily protein (DUF2064 family)
MMSGVKPQASGPILILFANAPGGSETTAPHAAALGAGRARALEHALLLDSIELVHRVSPRGIRGGIAWGGEPGPGAVSSQPSSPHPRPGADPPRPGSIPPRPGAVSPQPDPILEDALAGFELLAQEGDDPGARMANSFAEMFAKGHDRVVILGTGTPSLPIDILYRAFELLRDRDLVLGPSLDGGYYLIGARSLIPEMFRGIPWGTDRVLPETLKLLKILGLPRLLLPDWYSAATEAGLERLRQDLTALPADDPAARHTRAVLFES